MKQYYRKVKVSFDERRNIDKIVKQIAPYRSKKGRYRVYVSLPNKMWKIEDFLDRWK